MGVRSHFAVSGMAVEPMRVGEDGAPLLGGPFGWLRGRQVGQVAFAMTDVHAGTLHAHLEFVPLVIGIVWHVEAEGIAALHVEGGLFEAGGEVVVVEEIAAAGDVGHQFHGGMGIVADGGGIHLRFEAAAAADRQRGAGSGGLVGRYRNAFGIDDVEDDALLGEALRGLADLGLEALDSAVGTHAIVSGDSEHGEAGSDPHQIFAAGYTSQVRAERLHGGQTLLQTIAARGRIGHGFEVQNVARHLLGGRLHGGVTGEHIHEGLGFDDGLVVVSDIDAGHAEGDLVEAGAEGGGIVGEIVKDAELGSHEEDGDASVRLKRSQVTHHLGARHGHLNGRRVEGVEDECGDIAGTRRRQARDDC